MIAIENEDRTVQAVYSHWSGDLCRNGNILREHYYEVEKIRALLALGDISILRENIGEKHPFDDYESGRISGSGKISESEEKGWTKFYGRDRDEPNTQAKKYKNLKAFLKDLDETWCEYVYLYKADTNKWYYTDIFDDKYNNLKPEHFKLLTTSACKKKVD